jgi:hypothetical protein
VQELSAAFAEIVLIFFLARSHNASWWLQFFFVKFQMAYAPPIQPCNALFAAMIALAPSLAEMSLSQRTTVAMAKGSAAWLRK